MTKDIIFYSASPDETQLFGELEDKIRVELSKEGYTIAKCETNKRFSNPEIQIDAYNYKTQIYINGVGKIEPAQKGWLGGKPMMKYLRIRLQM